MTNLLLTTASNEVKLEAEADASKAIGANSRGSLTVTEARDHAVYSDNDGLR